MTQRESFTSLADIALDSPPEAVHARVVANFFNRDQLIAFSEKQGKTGTLTTPEGVADELLELVKSAFFKERFDKQWKYESDPVWGKRKIELVVSETVGHMLTYLMMDADLFILKGQPKYIGNFPKTTIEGVKKTREQVRLLFDCFRAQRRSSSQ